jgi:5-(carboxyamino)imidazole ribonucleotide synthase
VTRIGIIGGGQLARMMALAGWNMGLEFSFLASEGESTRCVEGLGTVVVLSPGQTPEQLYIALGEPDVITVERERVDLDLLRAFTRLCAVHPNPEAVEACGDRFREKHLLDSLQLPSAPYRIANSAPQVADAANDLGLPVVVKNPTEGYDGKQQWHIYDQQQLLGFLDENPPGQWLVESRIDFEREISMVAARSANGDTSIYPPTENRHHNGILLSSIAPAAKLSPELMKDSEESIRTLLEAMDYVGVVAMECFVTADGLLINELAPRVHNSGHWTMLGEATSQFENHLRAILGLTLGATSTHRCHGMVNILGGYDQERVLGELSATTALHDYNKTPAPLRKRGHINVAADSRQAVENELSRLQQILYPAGEPDAKHS